MTMFAWLRMAPVRWRLGQVACDTRLRPQDQGASIFSSLIKGIDLDQFLPHDWSYRGLSAGFLPAKDF